MSKEDSVIKIVLEDLLARYKEDIIAIYGIGSYFDEEIPNSWKNNDIDIIAIVKSLKRFPKVDWTEVKFLKRKIEGKEVWIGFNSLEGYQNKDLFRLQSFSNYEWSVLDIKYTQNSVLLYGKDIRDQFPDINNLQFDFDDILARGLYHLDKSLGERNQDVAKKAFSKAIFKTAFFICVLFDAEFRDTRILRIGHKLKETSERIEEIKDITRYFEETMIFRTTGYYITEFKKLRDEFISFLLKLLESGRLHKKMSSSELKDYLVSSFSGFPHLLHSYNRNLEKNLPEKSSIKDYKGDPRFQSVNIIGKVKAIGKGHEFKRADGSNGTYASFIMEDPIGNFRVIIWNDQVRVRLFSNKNFVRNSTIEIFNGFLKTGYDDQVEIHIGENGNILIHENVFKPTGRLKLEITQSDILARLNALSINGTTLNRTPCHYCGELCSPSKKKCPKCGEPLTFKF